MKRFQRAKAIGLTVAVIAVVAGASFVGTNAVLSTASPKFQLTATQDFLVSSTVSASTLSPTPTANLHPGAQRYFWYTVSNPIHAQITVNDLHITGVTSPPGCAAGTNLQLTGNTFSGSFTVPAAVGATAGTASRQVGTISLINTGTNQQSCKNATFQFALAGTAIYTEVYNTSTAVASSLNPSVVGQSVTYTATVTGIVGSGQDPLPNGPTGSVTFTDGSTPICSNVAVTVGATTSTATCTPTPAYSVPGSHTIKAQFTHGLDPNDNFLDSNNNLSPLIQVVNLPSGCSGTYNQIIGNPASPTINGTNGNDYIYATGANYTINAGQGNDCIVAGDGNNTITAGNANNVIVAGNGKNTITAGNGTNTITVGNGSTNKITAGNGTNTITLGNGSTNKITAGNGTNTITLGTGAYNTVTVGNGTNTITITTPGNHDTITTGKSGNVAYLGSGTYNTFTGGKAPNTCHLPSLAPPRYNDTLTNCTAVTP